MQRWSKCFSFTFTDPSTADCSRPLGMTNSAIKDWQIAASSSKQRSDDHQCAVKYARLESNIFTFLGVVSVTLIALVA